MTLIESVFAGVDEVYDRAVKRVDEAISKLGADHKAGFPNTAYKGLPCYYAMTGKEVNKLQDLKDALDFLGEFKQHPAHNTTEVFKSGVVSALSAEITEAVKYADNDAPYGDEYHGHLTDAEIRELGVPLVTNDIPGVAVMINAAPSKEEAAEIVRDYQSKGIFVFLVGKDICQQVKDAGVNTGFKVRIVCCGDELTSVAHVVSVALRAAIIFGAVTPGDYMGMAKYTFDRIFAFVNAYAPLNSEIISYGGGAIALGFPVITNEEENVSRVPKSLIIHHDTKDWVGTSLEARDIKIKITSIDIPIAYSTAFEGEIIRKADMQIEIDGSRVDCCELVQTKEIGEIEDHKITVVGKDFDEFDVGSKISCCYVVEVAGKNMQPDFEPVFERKFHSYLNCPEGIMHTGQRDMIRIRVSKAAFEAGFRAKHIGEILYAQVMNEFDKVVDKCQVTIYTNPEDCTRIRHEVAIPAFDHRDARISSMTDESVEQFYTCIMCQAFSPSHVCIVTPERLGLCGAVSWLDAKATNELDPTGPCQIVKKVGCQDEVLGRFDSVNEAVKKYSNGALEQVTLYSIMEDPMTSCGCFECICGIEPMSNGVVIVNREYADLTPTGMTFADLASMTGGGVQTPGFMGHGKHFIASKKFMAAEGGFERIVWMPKELKETVADRLNAAAKEAYGIENFTDMIADETVCTEDGEALMNFLTEKNHPVLSLDPLM